MSFLHKVVCFLLMAVICLQFSNAQSVPDRCVCMKTSTKKYTLTDIEEFFVISPRHSCNAYELIVTLKDNQQRCLDPKKKLGTILRHCWARKNEGGSKITIKASECLQKAE